MTHPRLRFVALVLISLLFLALRADPSDFYFNEDDVIPVQVSASLSQHHNLDANWRLADGLPEYFRYDQYNFYSYNLFCHAVLKVFGSGRPFLKLKAANVVLQALAILMIVAAARASGAGPAVRLRIAIVLSVLPCMVQDAHMARPESFVYFVLAGVVWASSGGAGRCALSGLLVGVGAACKVTALAFAAVPAAQVVAGFRTERARPAVGLAALLGGIAAGFALGAPYAVVHPGAYLNGLRVLGEQYGDQVPFSEPEFSLPANVGKVLLFLLLLYGPMLALPALNGVRRVPAWVSGLTLASAATVGFFVTRPVFFERNISAGIVGLSVAACFLERRWVAAVATAASVCVMAYWSARIDAASVRYGGRLRDWELAGVGLVPAEWPFEDPARRFETCRGLVAVQDYGDGTSRQILEAAARAGAVPVATYRSVFRRLPTSTLQIYLDADVHVLRCRGE